MLAVESQAGEGIGLRRESLAVLESTPSTLPGPADVPRDANWCTRTKEIARMIRRTARGERERIEFVVASTEPPAVDLGDQALITYAQNDRIDRWFRHAMDGHPCLVNADIEYFVEDQVIHLEGSVTSRLAKQAVRDLAWGVREIRDVDARIAIDTRR